MKIYQPPKVVVKLQGRTHMKAVAEGELLSYDKLPGDAVGTAVVQYSQISADDFDPQMGKLADIYVGGVKVFAGYVIDAPANIEADEDVSQIVIADVKGLLRGRFIGEKGIGDQADPDLGFKQVGYDIVFNRDGFGDAQAGGTEWGASYWWTCSQIMMWIFRWYVPAEIATGGGTALTGTGWNRSPSNLSLGGSTVLAAIDQVAKLAGESWDLRPAKSGSCTYARIAAGTGTVKTVRLFRPGRGMDAESAQINHATAVQVRPSVQGSFDSWEAHSGGGVVETMFGTDSVRNNSLVAKSGTSDTKYVKRFALDVLKYAARNAGCNLTVGSRPKPLMSWLVTRVNRDGTLLAPPYTEDQERMKGPIIWIVVDKTEFAPQPMRVDDGYAIDLDWSTIEFEKTLKLVDGYGVKSDVSINDWDKADVYMTAAVRIEERQIETVEADASLPQAQKAMINRLDLVPEWRWKSAVPVKTDAGWQILSNTTAREICVDHADRLEDAATNAQTNAPAVQRTATVRFATVPDIQPGDRLSFAGRTVPAGSGELSVTDVRMSCIDGVPGEVTVNATNATVMVNPEDYMASRRPRQ